jgi:hypothetical protein
LAPGQLRPTACAVAYSLSRLRRCGRGPANSTAWEWRMARWECRWANNGLDGHPAKSGWASHLQNPSPAEGSQPTNHACGPNLCRPRALTRRSESVLRKAPANNGLDGHPRKSG